MITKRKSGPVIARWASEDSKLTKAPFQRPVSATYVSQQSCPVDCALQHGGGCYAESGRVGLFTHRLNVAALEAGYSPEELAELEAAAIRDLPISPLLRLHVVGDCSTNQAAQTLAAAVTEWQSRGGGPCWTYTHAWRSVDRVSWGPVSVFASCETLWDTYQAHTRGYPAALIVDKKWERPARSRFVECPEQAGTKQDCESCRLCTKGERFHKESIEESPVLVFRSHGPTRLLANTLAKRQESLSEFLVRNDIHTTRELETVSV